MPIDPHQVQAVFFAAAVCDDSSERAIVLEQQCGNDTELRNRVLALLKADDESNELPPPRVPDSDAICHPSAEYAPGMVIAGRYRLLEEIAQGGMGTVWVAQQVDPVRRQVALKLIKPGMDSRRVLSRFGAERQALALMDHPNIARVFDGGVTDRGRPYFVMEYVKGLPITDYCDQARLGLEERLNLFVQVCEATQHAHQKGIIHRDLKPSNVLVCGYDDKPVAKVIDFGLAKAMHEPLTEHTQYTTHGLMVGTPRYMSPEQAQLNNLDIDTRTDVYSLGVILYELLTGTTPLDQQCLKDVAWQEILRQIKEDEPPTPSSRLSSSGALPSLAEQRSLEPAQLRRAVRGDLDWIVMKALEKDRSRRYATASDLARDVERHLRDEPVEARRPAAGYLVRKFARRNRVALTTALLVSAALVAGTVVSTTQAIRAMRAERVAESERSEAERQRAAAERNFQNARKAVDGYFTSVSQTKLLNVPGLQPLRKELLESALAFYQQFIDQHRDDPTVQAELAATYRRVGTITEAIGSKEQALAAFHKSVEASQRLVGDHPTNREYQSQLAQAYHLLGSLQLSLGRPADAEASHRSAVEIRQKLADEDPGNQENLASVANYYVDLGLAQSTMLRLDAARDSLNRALDIADSLATTTPTVVRYQAVLARVLDQVGMLERRAGRLAESEPPFQRALEIREKLARENPGVSSYLLELARSYNNLNVTQIELGHMDDAEALFRRALELYEKLATENPSVTDYRASVAHAHYNLGFMRRLRGRPTDGEASYRRSLELYEELMRQYPGAGEYRSSAGMVYYNLGVLQTLAGQKEAAAQSWAAAATTYAATADLGYTTVDVFTGLGDALAVLGKWKQAADAFARASAAGDYVWKPLYQAALLQWGAGDEGAYRASCAELLRRHGHLTGVSEAVAIAMACMAGSEAVADMTAVLTIIQRAAATNPKNPVLQTLVGAVQFRAGQPHEAIATLKKSVPMHSWAAMAAPKQLDQLRVSQLTGEVILAMAYQKVGDQDALTKQLVSLRRLIEKLDAMTPQYSEGLGRWALPLTIHCAKRDLARLEADAAK